MRQRSIHSRPGFTLLEVILAISIAVMVMAVAIPSVTSALGGSKAQKAFEKFDAMVQAAELRSRAEARNYVIVWGRDQTVLMRPETPASRAEGEGFAKWDARRDGALELHLPAALTSGAPEAIWTFWADGVCEPAEVRCRGAGGIWVAVYNPFSGRAEVHYE